MMQSKNDAPTLPTANHLLAKSLIFVVYITKKGFIGIINMHSSIYIEPQNLSSLHPAPTFLDTFFLQPIFWVSFWCCIKIPVVVLFLWDFALASAASPYSKKRGKSVRVSQSTNFLCYLFIVNWLGHGRKGQHLQISPFTYGSPFVSSHWL